MEDLKLKCPLCCDIFFNSKQQLLDHLTKSLDNLFCPICNNKWSTVDHLIEHLTLDNCQNNTLSNSLSLDDDSQVLNIGTTAANTVNETMTDSSNSISENSFPGVQGLDSVVENGEVGKMYVELLGKQLLKPCLQTQELKLVKHDGGTHYVIITQPTAQLSVDTIVARQNNDGTISMTTVEDMQMSSDTLIAPTENEPEDNQEELYSCNTCGVSFSSVLDHIQNYHNDQDVVVEEPVEEPENDVQFVAPEDTAVGDKHVSRRMITETGDIVVAPPLSKDEPLRPEPPPELIATSNDGAGQSTRVYATRYVKIDNLCDSVVRDIKESEMKYACPHCPVTYGNAKSLYAHMKVHIEKAVDPNAPVTYECAVCSTNFPTNKSLKLHKRMHDPMKVRPIELPVENKDGSVVSGTKYLCQICDKLIPMDYRTVHQNSHKSANMYNCSICNKKFTSNEYLDMHMKVHNLYKVTVSKQDKLLPYKCLYCHRKFARPHEKVKHERIHTGEKPHSCEICGKSFRVSYCLTLHMRTHTGARPYACPHCGKRFKAHSVYNHHLLTHSEVRAYKCPFCPKTFKTSVQLAGHKNCHTKPFSCQHCNRPFASLYAVRVHMETHLRQNNLKFSCSLCGASYARAFALKDHVKQAHDQDVDAKENELTTQDEEWTQRETENVQTISKELLPTEIQIVGLSNNDIISS